MFGSVSASGGSYLVVHDDNTAFGVNVRISEAISDTLCEKLLVVSRDDDDETASVGVSGGSILAVVRGMVRERDNEETVPV